jgi:type VI secretion system ImpA family protein
MSEIAPVLDVARLLAPVSPEAPAGDDVRYDAAFDRLKLARREAEAIEMRPREEGEDVSGREAAVLAAWAAVADQSAEILRGKSKDLQATLWLAEALTRLRGFRGAMTGLSTLSGLIETYWDTFHPRIDPEDEEPLGFRVGLMTWVDERLPTVLKTAPITGPPDGYALVHYEATQKSGDEKKALIADGWPTTEQFDAALKSSSAAWVDQTLAEIETCRAAFEELVRVSDQRFIERRVLPSGAERVETLLAFGRVRETLDTAKWLVARVAKTRRPSAVANVEGTPATVDSLLSASRSDALAVATSNGSDAGWAEARNLVRQNQVAGFRAMQARLHDAQSGRDRFLRKLEFAEICLEAGVPALAFPLFDDVARTIQDRSLNEWEDRQVLLRAWKGLADCCEHLQLIVPDVDRRRQEALDQMRALSDTSS